MTVRKPIIAGGAVALLCCLLAWNLHSQQPDLRARIDKLIADARLTPTDETNGRERAIIVDEWASYLSHQGIVIPQLLLTNVATFKLNVFPMPIDPHKTLDWNIEELALKDKHPHGIGTIQVRNLDGGPLVVNTYTSLEFVYTAGEVPIQAGGGVRVGKFFGASHGVPQAMDRTKMNYVSFRASDPSVRLRVGTSEIYGVNGGFRATGEFPAVYIDEGTLDTGETLTITLGDRSWGGRGFRTQLVTNDRFIVPIYVDFSGNGNFMLMDNPAMELIGSTVARLNLVGPSIVAVDEPFRLRFRVEDEWWNPAGERSPPLEVLLDGKPFRSLAANPASTFSLDDVRLTAEGLHYFSARTLDGRIEGESNPILVKRDPRFRIWWGEMHGHSGFADGQGTEDGYYKYGRDVAFLDFCALSEHDLWQTGYSWQAIAEATRKYNDPGRFVTFSSYEWTAPWRLGGHHNVYFRSDRASLIGLREGAHNISLLYELLRRYNDPDDVLIIPHCHDPGTWLEGDPEMQRLVEIYSFHGSFEYYGQKFLNRGQRIGLIGGSDNHQTHPGYNAARSYTRGGLAAVVADTLTRDAVFDAMKQRSAYATSGERILIDFELNGQTMGSAAPSSKERELRVLVAGAAPLDRIEVVKNGQPVYGRDYIAGELRGKLKAQLMFRSASNSPGEEYDMPRGPRPWKGTLEVRGARLGSVEGVNFDRTFTSQAFAAYTGAFSEKDLDTDVPVRDEFEVNGNVVTFDLSTRGESDGLLLDLASVSASTEIHVRLEADVEGASYGGSVHKPRQLPARELTFSFSKLEAGRLAHDVGDADYRDYVSLQILRDDPVKHATLTYRDADDPADGDYYYIHVTQADGEQAWSSPIWVGP